MREQLLRGLAIGIAVLAVIDPALQSSRADRPYVALLDADAASVTVSTDDARANRAVVERARRALDRDFTVVSAPFAGVSATVVVGEEVPPEATRVSSPLFVVVPEIVGPRLRVEGVEAPRRLSMASRALIRVRVHARGARARLLSVTLRSGALLLDRTDRPIGADDERVEAELTFNPTTVGAVPLVIAATVERDSAGAAQAATTVTTSANVVIDVIDKPLSVLVHDARPSWMSTFVRRAIERDHRFAVTSRIVTSRNISVDAGRPPGSFDDAESLASYDAILVGAPEALTAREVTGLDRYLRRRGGSVFLLFDRASGGAYTALSGDLRWSATTTAVPRAIAVAGEGHPDSVAMRATAFILPMQRVPGARELALVRASGTDSANDRAVVWSLAVGAGQLIVSGALDAWRFRDESMSAFDRFWQRQVAEAGETSPPPLLLRTANRLVAPNEWVDVSVTLRGQALASDAEFVTQRAAVSASLRRASSSAGVAIRLWPSGTVGSLRGLFRAPETEGEYLLRAESTADTSETPIVVSKSATGSRPREPSLLVAWVRSRGGQLVPATELEGLSPMVARTLRPIAHPVTRYPMRSAWWILPFSFLLGAEWWLRRRSGRA